MSHKRREKIRSLINDLKQKPQNPAFLITKEDIIEVLSDALEMLDSIFLESDENELYFKNIIDDAYSNADCLCDELYNIKFKLKEVANSEIIKNDKNSEIKEKLEEIELDIVDVTDRADNLRYDLNI